MRTKVEIEVPISTGRPENMPECFGKEFDPRDPECLQCKAFNMCAYFRLKDYPDGYLDQSRILNITDEDISEFIGHTQTGKLVGEWLMTVGKTKDKVAVIQRLKRYIRDNDNVSYKNKIVTVL